MGEKEKKQKRRHVCMQMLLRGIFFVSFFFLFLFRQRWLLPLPVEKEAGARQNPSPGVERRRDGLAAPTSNIGVFSLVSGGLYSV